MPLINTYNIVVLLSYEEILSHGNCSLLPTYSSFPSPSYPSTMTGIWHFGAVVSSLLWSDTLTHSWFYDPLISFTICIQRILFCSLRKCALCLMPPLEVTRSTSTYPEPRHLHHLYHHLSCQWDRADISDRIVWAFLSWNCSLHFLLTSHFPSPSQQAWTRSVLLFSKFNCLTVLFNRIPYFPFHSVSILSRSSLRPLQNWSWGEVGFRRYYGEAQ